MINGGGDERHRKPARIGPSRAPYRLAQSTISVPRCVTAGVTCYTLLPDMESFRPPQSVRRSGRAHLGPHPSLSWQSPSAPRPPPIKSSAACCPLSSPPSSFLRSSNVSDSSPPVTASFPHGLSPLIAVQRFPPRPASKARLYGCTLHIVHSTHF